MHAHVSIITSLSLYIILAQFFAIQGVSFFAEVTASFRSALNKGKSLTRV